MQDTTAIIDTIYPLIQDKLSVDKNVLNWKKFISKFIQFRTKEFYSNLPCKQTYYSETDVQEYFKAIDVSQKDVKNNLKNTYYAKMANFNPSYAKDESTIALLCMVKYFKDKKMSKELDLAIVNLAFSGKFYPSIFYKHYRFEPAEYVMEYVITHMLSQKYDIIKYGNVINAVKSICNTWYTSYTDRFNEFHDADCAYLVQQLHNRIDSFVSNIADLYYKAYQNKDAITHDSDDVGEDSYHLADSDSLKVERIVQATMKSLTTKGVNFRICKIASNDNVKLDELRSIIESIIDDDRNLPIIQEFLSTLVSLYFLQSNRKDVKTTDFIIFAIKPSPNARNKYVIRKKELLDLILTNNATQFNKRRVRPATEAAYYRSINAYFALLIQESV